MDERVGYQRVWPYDFDHKAFSDGLVARAISAVSPWFPDCDIRAEYFALDNIDSNVGIAIKFPDGARHAKRIPEEFTLNDIAGFVNHMKDWRAKRIDD